MNERSGFVKLELIKTQQKETNLLNEKFTFD